MPASSSILCSGVVPRLLLAAGGVTLPTLPTEVDAGRRGRRRAYVEPHEVPQVLLGVAAADAEHLRRWPAHAGPAGARRRESRG